ncbi:UDP-N-acetylglucosamine 1-carboxyvinyltransferase [candidate division CSSED10-310 bacterium]|uniref:UDP-N-acetylglucosamine 1-carboxyvinyltransferase n=1 Tax=candidate division CSSED10-310 bacterium TaxID=2855610 RepID=A0ABV6Z4R7_UNCC1
MDQFIIHGGQKLEGEISISGAKNSALPILCASLLNGTSNIIHNIPQLRDIQTIKKLLISLGCKWERDDKTVYLDSTNISTMQAPYDLVKTMRASVLVLGPLAARFGYARLSLPGGCAIGARPINLHLDALRKMGAEITLSSGYVEVKVKKLKGARIYLDIPTVTGTENIMMAAVLADGETVIENAAMEPEITDLANVLVKMGAKIKGQGTDSMIIKGVKTLRGFKHTVIPDRIEAGTFLIAGVITKGKVVLRNADPAQLYALIGKLRNAGANIKINKELITISANDKLRCVDIKTLPYPGFATDMQAQFMALMAVSDGLCVITETIFENRFMHVSELCRMGANIRIEGAHAIVTGVKKLSGAPVMATDLRASACLVLAGLVAEGETRIQRVYHIDRGYVRIEEKLRALGADIIRAKSAH